MTTRRAEAQPLPCSPKDATALLRGAVDNRDRAQLKIAVAVEVARLSGLTWDEIGGCLGMTKQGAHDAFSRLVKA